ncbi:unnamed protein product [Pieris macdunnoughi]|uniref:DDE Tnp4 domain-containing protein n=1 Tax=Pieris macdunnoughi TaxID=345717 RepID=A0A821UHB4_9NEOP|nr:unnamed protein product [Pieris macdunnoughi]
MDVQKIITLTVLVYLLRKRKRKISRKRQFWVHPLLCERKTKGLYYTYFLDLKMYEKRFFNYMRMSTNTFNLLLDTIKPKITGTGNNYRKCIPAEEKLVITIRYLATGCSLSHISHEYRIGLPTVSEIVFDVCEAIWEILKPIVMPQLTRDKWIQTAEGFQKYAQFPNCIGAIDGKHIRVIKPQHSGSLYYNYKNYFSIVLLAICDVNYKFLYLDIGAYGKCSDSSIYKDSVFYHRLLNNDLDIPSNNPIKENGQSMPFVLVGDEAFSLSEHMMRPYAGRNLNNVKTNFNYRLSRARRYIECTFGILANKWQILHRPLNVKKEFAVVIIKALCVLHNFVRERDGYDFKDTLTVPEALLEIPACLPNRANRTSTEYRDIFANYFSTDGRLPWHNL